VVTLVWAFAALWAGIFLTVWLAPKWNHPINPLAWVLTFSREKRDTEVYWILSIHWPRKPGASNA